VRFPGPGTDPRETLEIVRRWEIISGVGCIALGLIFWNEGWWHWALIGIGVFSVLPWGGARTVLRKAEKDPDVLVWDPERRRARARRIAIFQTPIWIIFGGAVGYVIEGWPFAIALAVLFAISAGVVSWQTLRRQ
jgi:hypothetical protein